MTGEPGPYSVTVGTPATRPRCAIPVSGTRGAAPHARASRHIAERAAASRGCDPNPPSAAHRWSRGMDDSPGPALHTMRRPRLGERGPRARATLAGVPELSTDEAPTQHGVVAPKSGRPATGAGHASVQNAAGGGSSTSSHAVSQNAVGTLE